ncbi:hypothetical protein K435DRAFT_846498 [Dendrothele bispora CBS 962.96]|uniref:Uncharacterized protein n=1 Tax=Dendrothele bispora (strain CBS 962.96) TaxID=1314807 RepID=A0A4S8KMD8_DENBC|nr:hypothetical protein K435DRAFT_846498 [Dendrothele bispora CBS 962.96]
MASKIQKFEALVASQTSFAAHKTVSNLRNGCAINHMDPYFLWIRIRILYESVALSSLAANCVTRNESTVSAQWARLNVGVGVRSLEDFIALLMPFASNSELLHVAFGKEKYNRRYLRAVKIPLSVDSRQSLASLDESRLFDRLNHHASSIEVRLSSKFMSGRPPQSSAARDSTRLRLVEESSRILSRVESD